MEQQAKQLGQPQIPEAKPQEPTKKKPLGKLRKKIHEEAEKYEKRLKGKL